MPDLAKISAFHALRQNRTWPSDREEQEAALAKAVDYQRAFYPVRANLDLVEQLTFDDAMALLALEMVNAPAMRPERGIKKLKEASSSGASVETEWDAEQRDPFPQISAMFATLAPLPASSGGVRVSRMRP